MRDLLLVGAIVIHLPDFLGSTAVADEVELGLRNTLKASAKTENNLIGEAVRDEAGIVFAGFFTVLLAQDLRGLRVLDVKQPALHRQRAALHRNVAEGQHVGVGRRGVPVGQFDVLRSTGNGHRVEALRNRVEDAGRLEIVPQRDTKGRRQLLGFGIAGRCLEVGHGEANFLDAEAGASTDPILWRWSAECGTDEYDGKNYCGESFHSQVQNKPPLDVYAALESRFLWCTMIHRR